MIGCAHGNWSWVPEHRHLKPAVGRFAIILPFFHALPQQVAKILNSGTTRSLSGVFTGGVSHVDDSKSVVVRTSAVQ